jgi:glycosyltransferase involved in cell wall biosynthesis
MMKKVLVLGAQVPFIRGGAEMLNEALIAAINTKLKNVKAELVQLPFKWYPEQQILNDVLSWRLLDLTETNGEKIDLVIATKFPTYAARHANKVLWLVHQHRVVYDLAGTAFDNPHLSELDKAVREKIRTMDNKFITECRARFSIAHTVSDRLNKFNSIKSVPLFPPPRLAGDIRRGTYGDEIVYIGRIESTKRPWLLVDALNAVPNARAAIVGTGKELGQLQAKVKEYGIGDRCRITGFVSDEELLDSLSRARAVFYAPVDEDYGFATIEAFLAGKPVITCSDSGEVARFVRETGSGWVTKPYPSEIAESLKKAYALSSDELGKCAEPGYEAARQITWENVLSRLVSPFL